MNVRNQVLANKGIIIAGGAMPLNGKMPRLLAVGVDSRTINISSYEGRNSLNRINAVAVECYNDGEK